MKTVNVTWFMLDDSIVTTVEQVPVFDDDGELVGHREARTRCRVNIKGNIPTIIECCHDWAEFFERARARKEAESRANQEQVRKPVR